MGLLELVFKLSAPFVGILAKHGDRALVFTRGELLKIDVIFFEEPVEIRELCDNTNRPQNGKRRR